MISSNKINVIAILLIALVTGVLVYAILFPDSVVTARTAGTVSYDDIHEINITDDDYYTVYTETSAAKINLLGETAETNSPNVEIDEGTITILGGGIYVLSGSLDDGSIIVDSADDAAVKLFFNGVNVISSDFSAVYVKQAGKTIISLVPGTENTLSDGGSYDEEKVKDGKPSAALYSKDDLTINGSGTLTINGNYKDALKANDTLKITEGSLSINAADNGINTNDYIAALDVNINIVSGGDGIKCDGESEEKGFIVFEGTSVSIESGEDGISASSALFMNDMETNIVSGGGYENAAKKSNSPFDADRSFFGAMRSLSDSSEDSSSTKAVKAGTDISINGGSFTLNSADDCLHSDSTITIEGGAFSLSSGDDAVHSDKKLVLNPESINILTCVEGLESAYITINGGNIIILSDDDGINATGENSQSGFGGFDGSEEKIDESDMYLTINGGNIYIETSGDGIDSNGSAVINGGFIQVFGPENDGNASIDVGDGGYALVINGGTLFAAGSSGMAEQPSKSSLQNSAVFYLEESYDAESQISLTDSSGSEIISGVSNKKFNWFCISADSLNQGETYYLSIDGEKAAEITLDSVSSVYGNKSGGMGGSGGMGRSGGGRNENRRRNQQ